MKSSVPCLSALFLWPAVCLAQGDYGSVQIDEEERENLIETSSDLEAYFESQSLMYRDDPLLATVREIGETLSPVPMDSYIRYRFFVLRDPSPNAFALPNGHIYITTGMLARLDDEAQLAAILAHEINHVAGHHGILDDRSTTKKQVAMTVIGRLGGVASVHYDVYGDIASAWFDAMSRVITIGLAASVYGFSRELEQEADTRALVLLLDSPYDPHALPEVFRILRQDFEGLYPRVPTMWSTHPELDLRIEIASALVEDAPVRDREGDSYRKSVQSLRVMTIQDYIQDDYPQTALALAQSIANRNPGDPQTLQLLGNAWQAMGAQTQVDPENWSERDKRRNRRDRLRKTRDERLQELLETEEGRAAYAENLLRAEQTYNQVLDLSPNLAEPHRGLGEVYEKLGRYRDAAAAYLTYVRAAPEAPDRVLIIDRLREINDLIRREE